MRIVLSLFTFLLVISSASPATIHFDYTQSAQQNWGKTTPQCAGYSQSPVVIAASRSVALPLPALELIGYHDYLAPPLIFKNNGHTALLYVKHNFSTRRAPYIFGALLNENQEYELEGFHFHWGNRNSRGSEHVLHGTRYPMEMHLVHRNMKYSDVYAALEYEDGLAVLGIFFHLQEEDNDRLTPIISHLSDIQWINTETRLNVSISLATLLPDNLETYYTYRGSLTVPPCNEAVTWIVFADSVPISFKQMSKFRLLSNGKGVLADNYRFLQDLGNRKIYVRRPNSVFSAKNEVIEVDVSSIKWYW